MDLLCLKLFFRNNQATAFVSVYMTGALISDSVSVWRWQTEMLCGGCYFVLAKLHIHPSPNSKPNVCLTTEQTWVCHWAKADRYLLCLTHTYTQKYNSCELLWRPQLLSIFSLSLTLGLISAPILWWLQSPKWDLSLLGTLIPICFVQKNNSLIIVKNISPPCTCQSVIFSKKQSHSWRKRSLHIHQVALCSSGLYMKKREK